MILQTKRLIALGLVVVGTTMVWLIALPQLCELRFVRERIENNRAAGINPTAVFYTDHPGMVDIERKIESRVDSPSRAFWKISR